MRTPYRLMTPDERKAHVHRQCVEARGLMDVFPDLKRWQVERALLDVFPDQRKLIKVMMGELFA